MKRFLIALALLCFVLSGTLFLQNRVSRSANDLLAAAKPLEETLLLKDASGAIGALEEFHNTWHHTNGWMYLLLAHERMDDLESASERLLLSLKIEDFSGALRALSDIQSDLSSIAEKDTLSWKNLL